MKNCILLLSMFCITVMVFTLHAKEKTIHEQGFFYLYRFIGSHGQEADIHRWNLVQLEPVECSSGSKGCLIVALPGARSNLYPRYVPVNSSSVVQVDYHSVVDAVYQPE